MKSMQSNKKKFNRIIRPKGRERSEIEKIVRNAYESLPTEDKGFFDDAEQYIQKLTQTIIAEGEQGRVNPYATFKEVARFAQRQGYYGTKKMIFSAFREQKQQLYNRYNSYMFRRGYKSTQYFYDNADASQSKGSIWEVEVELPEAPSGRISYTSLYIEFDFSSGKILNAIMS